MKIYIPVVNIGSATEYLIHVAVFCHISHHVGGIGPNASSSILTRIGRMKLMNLKMSNETVKLYTTTINNALTCIK